MNHVEESLCETVVFVVLVLFVVVLVVVVGLVEEQA